MKSYLSFVIENKALKDYTNSSETLNRRLRENLPIEGDFAKMHNAIIKKQKPLKGDLKLYHGTTIDPREQHKNGYFKVSGHMSTSSDEKEAHEFGIARKMKRKIPHHILAIHAKQGDKTADLSKVSVDSKRGTSEHVIAHNTNLKYSHSEDTKNVKDHRGNIHSFTVHHYNIEKEK